MHARPAPSPGAHAPTSASLGRRACRVPEGGLGLGCVCSQRPDPSSSRFGQSLGGVVGWRFPTLFPPKHGGPGPGGRSTPPARGADEQGAGGRRRARGDSPLTQPPARPRVDPGRRVPSERASERVRAHASSRPSLSSVRPRVAAGRTGGVRQRYPRAAVGARGRGPGADSHARVVGPFHPPSATAFLRARQSAVPSPLTPRKR